MFKTTKAMVLTAALASAALLTAEAVGSPSQPGTVSQAQSFQANPDMTSDRGRCVFVVSAPTGSGSTPGLIMVMDAVSSRQRDTIADCVKQASPFGQASVASYTGVPATSDGRVIHF